MVKLAPIPKRAFDAWIKHGTWYTGHDCDLARFHAFVWAVVRFSRRPPSESDIRELIRQKWEGRLYDLDAYALNASRLYQSLYDFGKAQKTPGVAPREVEQHPFEMHAQNKS